MPITIDIENDFLYKKGKNEGREEEREIYHKKTINAVLELFKLGLSTQNIANALSLSLEKVERILREK